VSTQVQTPPQAAAADSDQQNSTPNTSSVPSAGAKGTPASEPSLDQCSSGVFHEAQRTVRKHGGVRRNQADIDQIVSETTTALTRKESPCVNAVSAATIRALSVVAMKVPLDGNKTKQRPGFVTSDGAVGDVIFDYKTQTLIFAVWSKSNNKVRLHPVYQIDANDEGKGYYVPPTDPFESIEKKVVALPTGVRPYDTTAQLVEKIKKFIRDYYHAPEIWMEIMAYFALMTWVTEKFHAVPHLRWLGEPETGKTRGLVVVAALSFRPTSISGASSVPPMFRLIEKWKGTLVVDEADFRNQTEMWDAIGKILNQGYLRHLPVMRSDGKDNEPRPFDVFGPKILSTRQPFADVATETRCITFPTKEAKVPAGIPLHLQEQFYTRAQELQNELLHWRIDNLDRIKVDEQEIRAHYGNRLAQIGSALLAVVDDQEARQRIIAFLGQEGIREKRNREAVMVLEALSRIDAIDVTDDDENPTCNDAENCCHLPKDGTLLIKHVTCFANQAARDFGHLKEKAPGTGIYLSMQEVGSILRSLGFNPKRTKLGNEVLVDAKLVQEKLSEYNGVLNE
jgi:hypothetical protein